MIKEVDGFRTYTDKKWGTKTSILLSNYKNVTSETDTVQPDTGSKGHFSGARAHKYSIDDQEVYSRRAIFSIAPDKTECSIQSMEEALGGWFKHHGTITITKEQFELLKSMWR